MADSQRTLFIACGALAREFLAVSKASGWDDRVEITCLPAIWHNRPDKIPEGVRRKIRAGRKRFERIFVLYGDCGTGGELDRVLAEEGVERIEGPHCYQWFAGTVDFGDVDHSVRSMAIIRFGRWRSRIPEEGNHGVRVRHGIGDDSVSRLAWS